MECKKLVPCSNNKQIAIYELLSKAHNLLNSNNETVLASKFNNFYCDFIFNFHILLRIYLLCQKYGRSKKKMA